MIDILAILTGVFTRLVIHWPNFTAVGGLSLFLGSTGNRKWSWAVPLLTMLISDLLLSRVYGLVFHPMTLVVYGSFLAYWLLGTLLRDKKTPGRLIGLSLLSSLLFFLITNNVFLATGASLYPKTLAGLLASYTAGLPFLAPTAIGDLATSAIAFSIYWAVLPERKSAPKLATISN